MAKTRKKQKNLRIVALGGLEEIGRNMMLFEYGKDIIIIDMGLQFPEEDMPGIDYIIPNISYLRGREKNIRGVIITHGHYDHIGAIPLLIDKIGNPPIFGGPLTCGIIARRQEEFPNKKINLRPIKVEDVLNLGCFKIEFFRVNHNIPDTFGIIIRTPVGNFVHTGDFKFDPHPVDDNPADIAKIARIGDEGVLGLFSDSTDAETPGHSISEKTIGEALDLAFQKANGRIIATTFSSLISRIQQIITLAEKYDRKVAVDGYSMKSNIEISKKLGYLKVKKNTLISAKQIKNYPEKNIVILCTGAQGEDNAVLMRIINGEHRHIKIHKKDTVVFSSSVIPGNERTVQGIKDLLYRQGANVIHYKMMDVHAGGHAQQEDLKMMIYLVRPKYFIPIHGNYYMRKLHADLAESVNIKSENIFLANNGQMIKFDLHGNGQLTQEKIPSHYVMVDGLGVGDVGEVVLRDRQMMARDGMFTIIIIVDSKAGKIIGEPDIISRGFIYLRESKGLLEETKKEVAKIVAPKLSPEYSANWNYVKSTIRDKIGEFLFKKTQRRPMVLPVIIEV